MVLECSRELAREGGGAFDVARDMHPLGFHLPLMLHALHQLASPGRPRRAQLLAWHAACRLAAALAANLHTPPIDPTPHASTSTGPCAF